jgi:hypothetical protein
MRSSKAHHKDTPLLSHFRAILGNDLNLSRTRFVSGIVCALIATRSVTFGRLALDFDGSDAKAGSVYRRIQRFMAGFHLADDLVCRLVTGFLGPSGPFDLVMDRTDWEIGLFHINILALGIRHKGCAIPVLFTVLPKKGTSNTAERIALMDRFIRMFGRERISSLAADREFIGAEWFGYLTGKTMDYFIRLRNNTLITGADGRAVSATRLFRGLGLGEYRRHRGRAAVFGVPCHVSATRVKAKGGRTELMLIASFGTDRCPFANYRERWQVETMFKAMKSSGFNINKTHLMHRDRIENLLKLVMIAYCWCSHVGAYLHLCVKPIKVKKDGRWRVSIFRYGLDHIVQELRTDNYRLIFNDLEILSCT